MTRAETLVLAKLLMEQYVDSLPKRIEKAARKREKKRLTRRLGGSILGSCKR